MKSQLNSNFETAHLFTAIGSRLRETCRGLVSVLPVALLALLAAVPGCAHGVASGANALASAPEHGMVEVNEGRLDGVTRASVTQFYGVPYATPPLGELRWAPPLPPQRWSGVRDATKPRTACAQPNADNPAASITNEDCLYVNITTPRADSRGRKLPVMVWLHGGGLSTGSSNDYDPSRMAEQGDVVVITVESRLNVMGYFALPGMPGASTFGLQDEQAALKWIRSNARAFGGDPHNITLFGESGGSARTCAHITSPLSAGLFDKAIMESGGCTISWPLTLMPGGSFWKLLAELEAQGSAFAQKLGCMGDPAAQLACLRQVPAAKLIAEGGLTFANAAYGTPVLPLQPTEALETGQFSGVPVLSGNNRDEGRAFVGFLSLVGNPMTEARYTATLKDAFGSSADEVHARYPSSAYPGQPDAPALAWAAVITDRMFACPQLKDMRLIHAKASVHGYLFDDPHGIGLVPFPPGFPSGASHSSELPLLFDLTTGAPLDFATKKTIQLSQEQKALGATMIQYWTHFAHDGDPNGDNLVRWPRYRPDSRRPRILQLGVAPLPIEPVDSYAIHQCAFWEPFLPN